MKKENSSQTENKGVNHGTKHTEGTKKTVQKRSSGAKGKAVRERSLPRQQAEVRQSLPLCVKEKNQRLN